MKSAIITTILSFGIAFSASTAYAASVTGLNSDLLSATSGAWCGFGIQIVLSAS